MIACSCASQTVFPEGHLWILTPSVVNCRHVSELCEAVLVDLGPCICLCLVFLALLVDWYGSSVGQVHADKLWLFVYLGSGLRKVVLRIAKSKIASEVCPSGHFESFYGLNRHSATWLLSNLPLVDFLLFFFALRFEHELGDS